MNRRQAKKLFKQLCYKYGPRISETYADGRMTKQETRKVKSSLHNVRAVLMIIRYICRETPKIYYNFDLQDDRYEYYRNLNNFLTTKQIEPNGCTRVIILLNKEGEYNHATECKPDLSV